jgi:hypothetical protein
VIEISPLAGVPNTTVQLVPAGVELATDCEVPFRDAVSSYVPGPVNIIAVPPDEVDWPPQLSVHPGELAGGAGIVTEAVAPTAMIFSLGF